MTIEDVIRELTETAKALAIQAAILERLAGMLRLAFATDREVLRRDLENLRAEHVALIRRVAAFDQVVEEHFKANAAAP